MPCSAYIPLIPSMSCLVPPDGVFLYQNSSIARIGSKFFTGIGLNETTTEVIPITNLDDKIGHYWEEVCTRNDILVTCRRRVPRAYASVSHGKFSQFRVDSSSSDSDEFGSDELGSDEFGSDEEAIKNMKQNWRRLSMARGARENRRNLSKHFQAGSDHLSIESAEESLTDSDSDSGVSSKATSGSFMCSDAPHGIDDDPEENVDIELNTPPPSANVDHEDPDAIISDNYSAGYASSTETNSANRIIEDSMSQSDSDSVHTGSIYSQSSHDDEAEAEALGNKPENNYTVSIVEPKLDVECCLCWEDLPSRRYTCNICKVSLCRRCVGYRRKWCPDKNHQLYDLLNGNLVGAILRAKFVIKQELHIFQTLNGIEVTKKLFAFRERYESLLHESPPVIHLQHPLAVWPLSGSQILFADFEQNKYFLQKIRSNTKGGRYT